MLYKIKIPGGGIALCNEAFIEAVEDAMREYIDKLDYVVSKK